jgi:hypothetical protein
MISAWYIPKTRAGNLIERCALPVAGRPYLVGGRRITLLRAGMAGCSIALGFYRNIWNFAMEARNKKNLLF